MFSRRQFLAAAAAGPILGAPAVLRAQEMRFADYPFRLGAASGDPAADGFVIWTRLCPDPLAPGWGMAMAPVAVTWEVAEDSRFATIAAKGEAIARPELGHAVHVEVAGLKPDRPYFYRFRCGGERTATGRARTLPPAGAPLAKLRFAVAGCQHYEMGLYTAYRHLAREQDLALVYHYGDYIYEGRRIAYPPNVSEPPFVRSFGAHECYTLDDYRQRYAQTKMDADLQAAHHAVPFVAAFDDHEVHNNWVGDLDGDVPPELFVTRRAAAFQAWYEHMPVRAARFPRGGHIALARDTLIGDLIDLRVLDTRQYRTDQPCEDGFKPACPVVEAKSAQVLDPAQERQLLAGLARPRARWVCLAQQVMMMNLDRRTGTDEPAKIMNMDSWAGYETPRMRLIEHMGGRGDVVVLTGDEHQNFAGHLTDARGRNAAVEFVATSISSGGDGSDRRIGTDRMLAENPNLVFMNDQRGYAVCDVTPDTWATDFMVVDKVSAPGGVISRRARLTTERGTATLVAAT